MFLYEIRPRQKVKDKEMHAIHDFVAWTIYCLQCLKHAIFTILRIENILNWIFHFFDHIF